MTDDVTSPAPVAEPSPPPEPAALVPPSEPAPSPVEPAPSATQATSAEPDSVIPEESQLAPESTEEPPQVEVNAPDQKPATQSATSSVPQQSPAGQSSQSVPSAKWSAANRAHAAAKRVGRKEVRLAKVVELAKEKGRITNDDIEKLLHVSDATASRYGTILVQRGQLKREGKGRAAKYMPSQ
jgi:hypothetical protein